MNYGDLTWINTLAFSDRLRVEKLPIAQLVR